jgi:hypothetical protein
VRQSSGAFFGRVDFPMTLGIAALQEAAEFAFAAAVRKASQKNISQENVGF